MMNWECTENSRQDLHEGSLPTFNKKDRRRSGKTSETGFELYTSRIRDQAFDEIIRQTSQKLTATQIFTTTILLFPF
jgi:hypothetical protein